METTLVRLKNDQLSRLFHNVLFNRIKQFCDQYTPEIPGEIVADTWLRRVFDNDESFHLLVRLDTNYNVVGHAVIEVQQAYGFNIVFCHQAMGNTVNIAHIDEGIEYMDKLASSVNAKASVFVVTKGVSALQRKYGYKVSRTIMMKNYEEEE